MHVIFLSQRWGWYLLMMHATEHWQLLNPWEECIRKSQVFLILVAVHTVLWVWHVCTATAKMMGNTIWQKKTSRKKLRFAKNFAFLVLHSCQESLLSRVSVRLESLFLIELVVSCLCSWLFLLSSPVSGLGLVCLVVIFCLWSWLALSTVLALAWIGSSCCSLLSCLGLAYFV